MAEVGGTTDVGAPEAEGRGHAEGGAPQLLDADALIDDIIAKKGPYQYTEGLSEDNWEQVQARAMQPPFLIYIHTCTHTHTYTHARSWSRFLSL